MMAFGYYPPAWSLAIACELSPPERLVLLAIADAANEEGVCWPGADHSIKCRENDGEECICGCLATVTGLGERTVRRALIRLEGGDLGEDDPRPPLDAPLIKRTRRSKGRGYRTSDLTHLLFRPEPARESGRPSRTHAYRPESPTQPARVTDEPLNEPRGNGDEGRGTGSSGVVGELGRIRPLGAVSFARAAEGGR